MCFNGNIDNQYEIFRKCLNALNTARLRFNLDKCTFGTKDVKYFGFIIDAGNVVKIEPEKVEVITK